MTNQASKEQAQRDFIVLTGLLGMFTSGTLSLEQLFAEIPQEEVAEKMEDMTHIVLDLEEELGDSQAVDAHATSVAIEILKEIFARN